MAGKRRLGLYPVVHDYALEILKMKSFIESQCVTINIKKGIPNWAESLIPFLNQY